MCVCLYIHYPRNQWNKQKKWLKKKADETTTAITTTTTAFSNKHTHTDTLVPCCGFSVVRCGCLMNGMYLTHISRLACKPCNGIHLEKRKQLMNYYFDCDIFARCFRTYKNHLQKVQSYSACMLLLLLFLFFFLFFFLYIQSCVCSFQLRCSLCLNVLCFF